MRIVASYPDGGIDPTFHRMEWKPAGCSVWYSYAAKDQPVVFGLSVDARCAAAFCSQWDEMALRPGEYRWVAWDGTRPHSPPTSETLVIPGPDNPHCATVPEPSLTVGLVVGVIFMRFAARRRSKDRRDGRTNKEGAGASAADARKAASAPAPPGSRNRGTHPGVGGLDPRA